MIREVTIRRFKRFEEQKFLLDGHVVLAGPNNMGKTTLLQAIAAWDLALNRWRLLNDPQKHGGAYTKAPIARQAFMAVPLRNYELMWTNRDYRQTAEVEVLTARGEKVCMEFIPDSTEQIYVRPKAQVSREALASIAVRATYVPPMSGLGVEEPVYQRPKIDQLLALQKPGDVLRNLLVEAHAGQNWGELVETMRRLFNVELLPPDATGADIVAEYRQANAGARLDVRSAGSGFQQVLMLLTFLHTRPGAVLLIDEPDAHLHVYLQDSIYGELRRVAARTNSQLIVATHSEVIINSVAPEELCAMYARPMRLSDGTDRQRLADSLGVLTQTDAMLATEACGVLYVEGHTDLDLLREWAKALNHRAYAWLSTTPFWRATVQQHREDAPGIQATEHHEALKLVRPDLPALELRDSDARRFPDTAITGTGFQRLRWRRYEIESYLLHPAALARFVAKLHALPETDPVVVESVRGMMDWARDNLPPAVARDMTADHEYLNTTKARASILPPMLQAAGFSGLPYTRYSEIAAVMRPDEIHSEVREKLDAIATALRLP